MSHNQTEKELKKDHDKNQSELYSLRGTFFSTVVFVGGAMALWTGTLLFLYLMRF